jgi:hypothetical protein
VGYRFVGDVSQEPSTTPPQDRVADASVIEPIPAAERQSAPTAPAAEEVIPGLVRLEPDATIDGSVSIPEGTGRLSHGRWAVYTAAVMIVGLVGFAVWFGATGRPPAGDGERRIESIAVLPLENLSQDAAQDYFADA